MRAWTAEMAMAMVLVSGCCRNVPLIHIAKFERLPLREQIAVFDEAKRKHCVLEPDGMHLLKIAGHGEEAADAMTSSLKGSGPAFPPRDAIRVLVFVHFGGVDLRQREALRVLEELARSAPDPLLRKQASAPRRRSDLEKRPARRGRVIRGGRCGEGANSWQRRPLGP